MAEYKTHILLNLIDYLTDENIGKLISYIYGIEDFINPYENNRELMLNLLLGDIDKFRYGIIVDYIYTYLVDSKVKIDDTENITILIGDVYEIYIKWLHTKMNNYLNIDYSKLKNNFLKNITEDDFIKMFKFIRKNILPFPEIVNSKNQFFDYICQILESIISFDIKVKSNDKSRYKRYLNNIILRIIKEQEFYKLECSKYGNKLLLIKFKPMENNHTHIEALNSFNLIENKKGVFIKGLVDTYKIEGISTIEYKDANTQSLIGSPDTTNFDKKLEEIDKAVKNYLNAEKTCKMCGRPYSKHNRCKDCQELMDLILNDNKERFKNNKYNIKYAIEKLKFSKSSYSNSQLRKIRYENVKNLLNNVKITNKNHVEELVNKMFGDIEPFHF